MDDKELQEKIAEQVAAGVKAALDERDAQIEKVASDRADAFEAGIRHFMKKAGIEDEKEQEAFLATAQEIYLEQAGG